MKKLFYKLYAEAWKETKEKYSYGYYGGDYFFKFESTFSGIVDEIDTIRCSVSNYKENKTITTIEVPYKYLYILRDTLESNYGFRKLDEYLKQTIQDQKNRCMKVTKQKMEEYIKKTLSDSIDEYLKKIGTELESNAEIEFSQYGDEDVEVCMNLCNPEIGGLYIDIVDILDGKRFEI